MVELENISFINVLYQLIILLGWIGIIYLVVSLVRRSKENKNRLIRIEEKLDNLTKKYNEDI
ncbi:hypothetical protein QA612_21690 [Evansella sp. AB-P1]|uniref:hypothetical protein n=1 Tax=Evansella sp. AB-P1 TaxID=3037653 RepID=UPI00241E862E|nr:hypothetical protein [Evansella sp. AB-P1]MDG5790072.1 hypothetical protein [Evansella sp. AB-P1]